MAVRGSEAVGSGAVGFIVIPETVLMCISKASAFAALAAARRVPREMHIGRRAWRGGRGAGIVGVAEALRRRPIGGTPVLKKLVPALAAVAALMLPALTLPA